MAGTQSEGPTEQGVAVAWQPSQWVVATSSLLLFLYTLVLMFVAVTIASMLRGWLPMFLATSTSFIASIAVHELGHYLAARWSGMHVIAVRLGPIELAPRRRGWRARLRRIPHRSVLGSVLALPDPDRPSRPVFLRFLLGGIVANLIMVAGLVACALVVDSIHARLLLGAALCAAAVPLSNVLPFRSGMESDGLMALRWWLHPPGRAAMAPIRALARTMGGSLFSELPQDEAQAAERLSVMHAVYYALRGDLQRGAWADAAARFDTWQAAVPKDPRVRAQFAELTLHVRWDIAFAAAVHEKDASRLPDRAALRALRWGNPAFEARCRAAVAWMKGDHNALAVATVEALAVAGDSNDRSLQRSERLILEALAASVH